MKANNRGFMQSDEIVGPYKDRISVSESSGNNPCVWLKIVTHDDVNGAVIGRDVAETEAIGLLTVRQALELAGDLNFIVRNHFLLEWGHDED